MNKAATNLPPDIQMSREAYRQWAETQHRGRFERIDGRVVAMATERLSHALVKAAIWSALQSAVKTGGLPCRVYPDGTTIEAGDSDYEPDAVLRCGAPLDGDRMDIPDPLVIVEVLSSGTRHVDLNRKLVDYFKVPSLRHYLIFFTDQKKLIHHRLRDGGAGSDMQILASGDIRLDPPGLTITMDDIYDG